MTHSGMTHPQESGGACDCPPPSFSLSGLFRRCACCAGPAAGGALLSHVGCLLVPVFAGAAGALAHGVLFVASPLIAAGAAIGIGHYRGAGAFSRHTLAQAGISAGVALAITFGISQLGGGHDGHHHHDATTPAQAAAWFQSLPADDREKIEDIAKRAGIDTQDYVQELKGIPALSEPEKENLREAVGNTCPCQVPGACKIKGLTP